MADGHTLSEKEVDNEDDNSGEDMDKENEAYVHEAFLSDSETGSSNNLSYEISLSGIGRSNVQFTDMIIYHGTNTTEKFASSVKCFQVQKDRALNYLSSISNFGRPGSHLGSLPCPTRKCKGARVVKLAPGLPPINLPLPNQHVAEENASQSDLQMHPLLFHASEDQLSSYYSMNRHIAASVDFHPLLQRTDNATADLGMVSSVDPGVFAASSHHNKLSHDSNPISRENLVGYSQIPAGGASLCHHEKENELDLDIHSANVEFECEETDDLEEDESEYGQLTEALIKEVPTAAVARKGNQDSCNFNHSHQSMPIRQGSVDEEINRSSLGQSCQNPCHTLRLKPKHEDAKRDISSKSSQEPVHSLPGQFGKKARNPRSLKVQPPGTTPHAISPDNECSKIVAPRKRL
ncbi:hypothetical protein MUK42_26205 [Musa troglodytarum]|uniref:Uncharacterized protein n=1 Tax=Musa troglodytarum TaxID=320322 RepID=A0A9E7IA08_9LILI|nr:hypothetical protein MUK42_26205 [Musa troglodytarum]